MKCKNNFATAQLILGEDFVLPEEVEKSLPGIRYSDVRASHLVAALPGKDLLAWCKEEKCVLIPTPPRQMSLMEIRSFVSDLLTDYPDGPWYKEHKFALEEKTRPGWLFVSKDVRGVSMNWVSQRTHLWNDGKAAVSVVELVWLMAVYFKVRNIRLFEKIYIRTTSSHFEDVKVCVGYYDETICIDRTFDNDCAYGCIGTTGTSREL